VKDLPDPTGSAHHRLAEAIFECSIFVDKPPLELDKRLALTKSASENARRNQVLATMVARCTKDSVGWARAWRAHGAAS
jgi:hypothetical protein